MAYNEAILPKEERIVPATGHFSEKNNAAKAKMTNAKIIQNRLFLNDFIVYTIDKQRELYNKTDAIDGLLLYN